MRPTLGACRSMSTAPMYTVHGKPDARAGRGARHAVLARAGLGDDALRAEALRQQRLAERVVDLVRAGVREILALEPHVARPSAATAAARGSAPSAGPTQVLSCCCSSRWKSASRSQRLHALLEALVRRHQRLGHVAAAEGTVAAAAASGNSPAISLRQQLLALGGVGVCGAHGSSSPNARARGLHEFRDLGRALDARARLDAARGIDAERPHGANRRARHCPRAVRRPASGACAARVRPPAASR